MGAGFALRSWFCLMELALPCHSCSLIGCMKAHPNLQVLGKPVLSGIAVNGSLLHRVDGQLLQEAFCCSQAFAGLHSNSLKHGSTVPGSSSKRWAHQRASKHPQGGSLSELLPCSIDQLALHHVAC